MGISQIKVADKTTLDNIDRNTTINNIADETGTLSQQISYIIDKLNSQNDGGSVSSIENKLDSIIKLLLPAVEYKTAGSYDITIPALATAMKVTACAGGGGGGNATIPFGNNYGTIFAGSGGAGGGGGGAFVIDKIVTIPSSYTNTKITITVGSGGDPTSDGGSTSIGSLLILPGGKAGENGTVGRSTSKTSGLPVVGGVGGIGGKGGDSSAGSGTSGTDGGSVTSSSTYLTETISVTKSDYTMRVAPHGVGGIGGSSLNNDYGSGGNGGTVPAGEFQYSYGGNTTSRGTAGYSGFVHIDWIL